MKTFTRIVAEIITVQGDRTMQFVIIFQPKQSLLSEKKTTTMTTEYTDGTESGCVMLF